MKPTNYLFPLFLFFLLPQISKAQVAYFGANIGNMDLEGFYERPIVGLEFQYEFKNGFGIEYSLHAGSRYFQMPSSPVLGFITGIAISASKTEEEKSRPGGALLVGILIACIPEGIYYNIKVNDHIGICPHINPLQLNFIRNNYQDDSEVLFGGTMGVRLFVSSPNKKSRFAPFVDYKFQYQGNAGNGLVYGLTWFSSVGK
jgi:hypothetical protein